MNNIQSKSTKEVSKKLLIFLRLVFFIPGGYLIGQLINLPSIFIKSLILSFFGINPNFWVFNLPIISYVWVAIFSISYGIKPKMVSKKIFSIIWFIFIAIHSTIFIKAVMLPFDPAFPRINDMIQALAPPIIFTFMLKSAYSKSLFNDY